MVIIFSLSVMVLVFLLFYGMLQRKVRPQTQLHQRIDSIRNIDQIPTTQARKETPDGKQEQMEPLFKRLLKLAAEALGKKLGQLTPRAMRAWLARRLILAGKSKEWTVQQFFTVCALGAGAMLGFMLLILWHSNYALIQKLMLLMVGTMIGGFMPVSMLNVMIQKRQQAILRQLPEVLDLLCVSVQAGLSFDASLNKIVSRMKGPFVDECRRLLDDVRMGLVRRTAMKNLAARCDVQEVSLFMTSLIQAERLGTSMGKTLKNQADNMRERRRQAVKAEAMKAPVKIIFPLVLFIFPALFVVILVPVLLSLMKNM